MFFLLSFNLFLFYYLQRVNLKDYLSNQVENMADTIENMITLYSKNQARNCVGDKLTYADLFVYEMTRHYCPSDDMFVERYPKLFQIKRAVEENELVADYIKKKQSEQGYPVIKREVWKRFEYNLKNKLIYI